MTTKKNSSEARAEVRIGIADSNQELNFESNSDVASVQALVTAALDKGTTLVLTDARGCQVIVAANKISFVEVGESAERRVGFANL
jgi:hypothetical protein